VRHRDTFRTTFIAAAATYECGLVSSTSSGEAPLGCDGAPAIPTTARPLRTISAAVRIRRTDAADGVAEAGVGGHAWRGDDTVDVGCCDASGAGAGDGAGKGVGCCAAAAV